MRIRITAVDYQEEHVIVSCDSGIGMLKGIWKDKNIDRYTRRYIG